VLESFINDRCGAKAAARAGNTEDTSGLTIGGSPVGAAN
jgi:hypothetical protein